MILYNFKFFSHILSYLISTSAFIAFVPLARDVFKHYKGFNHVVKIC